MGLVLLPQQFEYLRLFIGGAKERIEDERKLTLREAFAVDVPVEEQGLPVEEAVSNARLLRVLGLDIIECLLPVHRLTPP